MADPRELDIKTFSPALVGLLRGALHAAALGVLNYLISVLGGVDQGDAGVVGIISTVAVAALRSIEGLLDLKLGAPRQRRLLGGSPVRRD